MRKFMVTMFMVTLFFVSCETSKESGKRKQSTTRVHVQEVEDSEIAEIKMVKIIKTEKPKVFGALSVKGFGTGGGGNALGIGGLGTRASRKASGAKYGMARGRNAVLNRFISSSSPPNSEQYESPDENGWKSSR